MKKKSLIMVIILILFSTITVAIILLVSNRQSSEQNPGTTLSVNGELVSEEYISEVENMLLETYDEYQLDLENEEFREQFQQQVIEQVVRDIAMKQYIKKEGFYDLSEEEYEVLYSTVDTVWEEKIQEYVAGAYEEYSETTSAETLRLLATAHFEAQGYTYQRLVSQMEDYYRDRFLQDSLKEGIEVGDEEVEEYFAERLAEDEIYAAEIETYEYMKYSVGKTMLFVPEGYRGILQILLPVDNDLMTLYTSAESDEERQRVRDSILEENKLILDEIYERIESGENFRYLIKEFGADDGMTDVTFAEGGYEVNRESVLFPEKFVEMCFGSEMEEPGDCSSAFVTENGIHVLYYLRDVPAGAIALTEEVTLMLAGEIIELKAAEKYKELSDRLFAEAVVEYMS